MASNGFWSKSKSKFKRIRNPLWLRLVKKAGFNHEEHEGHEGRGFFLTFVNFVFFVVKCIAIQRDKARSLGDFSTNGGMLTSHGGVFFQKMKPLYLLVETRVAGHFVKYVFLTRGEKTGWGHRTTGRSSLPGLKRGQGFEPQFAQINTDLLN